MKTIKSIGYFTLMGLMLVSCGDSESSKDVAYYLKNSEERNQKIEICQNQLQAKFLQYAKENKNDVSPKEFEPTSSCKNAVEAQKQAYRQEIDKRKIKHEVERQKEKEEQKKAKEQHEKAVDYLLTHEEAFTKDQKKCKDKMFDEQCFAFQEAKKRKDQAEQEKSKAEFEASVQYFLDHDEELQKAYKQCEKLNKLFSSECERVLAARSRRNQLHAKAKEKQEMDQKAKIKADFDQGVTYFLDHPQELEEKLQACHQPIMAKDLQCRQAREADLQRLLQKSKGSNKN